MDTIQKTAPVLTRKAKAGMKAGNIATAMDERETLPRGSSEVPQTPLRYYLEPGALENVNTKFTKTLLKRCLYRIEALERQLQNNTKNALKAMTDSAKE